jgi:hypothetical protein
MKQVTRILSLLLISVVILTTSCSDDDDPAAKSKTDLLTQHTWKFSAATSTDGLSGTIVGALLMGSEYTFKSDKTYAFLILGVSDSGAWSFNTDETKLTIDGDEYTLDKLDEAALEYSQTESGVTITYKYVKK